MKTIKSKYICPIRGDVRSSSKEEEYRIDCLKYLIDIKNIPNKNIEIEKVLRIFDI